MAQAFSPKHGVDDEQGTGQQERSQEGTGQEHEGKEGSQEGQERRAQALIMRVRRALMRPWRAPALLAAFAFLACGVPLFGVLAQAKSPPSTFG